MYLAITSRCQMRCSHCCFSCTERGRDMSMETVENALDMYKKLCRDSGSVTFTIGGGEPTLHPRFLEILEKFIVASALYTDDENYRPYIVSNGYDKDMAKKLIKIAERGLIGLRFSVDNFHQKLEHEDILMEWNRRNDQFYSTTLFNVTRHGRAKESGSWNNDKRCCCDTLIVRPTGTVYFCGCMTKRLGNVNTSYDIPEWYMDMQSDTEACVRNIRRWKAERKDI